MRTAAVSVLLVAGRAFALAPLRSRAPRLPPLLASASPPTTQPPASTVDSLLALIEGTDRGVSASPETRAEISSCIATLETSWKEQDALQGSNRDYLLRECEVKYVGQSSSKRANAAGGRFRGRFGRLLFATTALYQHVLPSASNPSSYVAVNMICFKLLGLVPGAAVLRGDVDVLSSESIVELETAYNRSLTPNTINARFDQPRVAFGRVGRGKGGNPKTWAPAPAPVRHHRHHDLLMLPHPSPRHQPLPSLQGS